MKDNRTTMADNEYSGPVPGDASTISADHGELVKGLYGLRERLKNLTPDERLILEMAIMMLDYQVEYSRTRSVEDEPEMSRDEIQEPVEKTRELRAAYAIHWTFEDFVRLICSGGFELADVRLVPRF